MHLNVLVPIFALATSILAVPMPADGNAPAVYAREYSNVHDDHTYHERDLSKRSPQKNAQKNANNAKKIAAAKVAAAVKAAKAKKAKKAKKNNNNGNAASATTAAAAAAAGTAQATQAAAGAATTTTAAAAGASASQSNATQAATGSTAGVVNLNSSPYSQLFAPAAAQNSTDAFSNFANHVYAVSTALIGMSAAPNPNSVTAMANSGFAHELLESIEAMVMARNTNNNGGAPLQSLIANTPCVLNGFTMAVANPSQAASLAAMVSTVRDSTILPNILALGQLSNAQNLLQFLPTGPLLQNPIQVNQPNSAAVAQAQQALGCAPGQTQATAAAAAGAAATTTAAAAAGAAQAAGN
ncbi:hypothetical protein BJ741DRAFT_584870 [Chytriomyces cf. hyalinus JEL632]|nr:hypothetical protein BJ741DRAFT_584870 [Chytriomyces cf. hyalinus JEL632]